ncbi:hypothetical protein HDU88_004738 [Geranomyces variabilis]|nr:hypothetical protein HDU88_004738 [Geranomyces variabilis]
MVSLLISISRLIKIINARSVFLVISSLGNAVFVLAVAYALHSSNSNFLASDQAGLVGLVIMLVGHMKETTYNNSVVCLHVSILLFIENIFETVTNALRGRGVFSQPSELSTFSRQHPHPYQNTSTTSYPPGAGGPSGKVVPEPAGGSSSKVGPAGSYIGRESWAFKGQEPGYGTAGPSYPPQGRSYDGPSQGRSYDSPNYPPNYPPARSYERPSGSRGG